MYGIIESLKKKTHINEITKWSSRLYSAISPKILLKQLEQNYTSFKNKVPEFLALAEKFGNKPKVQFFEGVEEIKNMYDDQIATKSTIKAFMGRQTIQPELADYFMYNFVPQRVKANILAKVILCDAPNNIIYHKKSNKKFLKESVLIEKDLFHLPGEILIYWPKVAIALYWENELVWIIIHSDKFCNMMESIFDLIWEWHYHA